MAMNLSTEGMNACQVDTHLRKLRERLHRTDSASDDEIKALNCALAMLGKAIMDAAIKNVRF